MTGVQTCALPICRLDGKSKEAVEVNAKIDKLLLAINSAYELSLIHISISIGRRHSLLSIY